MRETRRSILLGAAFLMATSAIGPGFLTQTTVFTQQLGASLGFVILVSVLLDIAAQLNIWRVLTAAEKRGQDVANLVLPGLGTLLAALIALGGLAFNIGNFAGSGLGMNALFGMDPRVGAVLSCGVAVALFLSREAGVAMDRFAKALGFVMIALTVYVALVSRPPVAEAALRTFVPTRVDALAIVTLVGGTVGGYITFAGGHRLLDAGIRGVSAVPAATRSAITGIGVATLMRIVLFMAALGVVSSGVTLDPANPPASVFGSAAGALGMRVFGLVMWAAAVTSVVGASYTSVSFLRSMHPAVERHQRWVTIGFCIVSTVVFVTVGRPVRVLILAGALNGLILPLALGVMLVAAHRRDIVGAYVQPKLLTAAGALAAVATAALGAYMLFREVPKLF